jgi:nitrate/TMAO reductase-like tetraheme cytochrome c subunit
LTVEFLPNNNCSVCHSVEKWNTITFDHNKTEFVLLGKHIEVTCRKCHYDEERTEQIKFMFASSQKACESCHKDIHYGQFEENGISNCERCHGFENWKAEKFNHNKTNFSIEGAHSKLDCTRCHPVIEEAGVIFQKFKLEDFKCAFCHK